MHLLGKDIRKLRLREGLSQSALSERIGCSVATIRVWERVPDGSVTGILYDRFLKWVALEAARPLPEKFKRAVKKIEVGNGKV